MNNSGNNTHKPRAVDPQTFRAKATGIGQSQGMSLRTGAARAQQVINSTAPECRKAIPTAEGYPAPMEIAVYPAY